ncbi:hypothetical protein E2C01_024599 [Portunus trituberculatus]|uniref:Uncharacterized protein n=1 Tax=Portunus trituberculatus TaxID=210409 RepID=A0A5B7EE84_PORTR|nr:hypothetical protein [Portunus trituberculatus]
MGRTGPSTLTKNRDFVRIASELFDVSGYPALCCYPVFSVEIFRSKSEFCILSYFCNSSLGSPQTEVALAFYLSQMGGTEEAPFRHIVTKLPYVPESNKPPVLSPAHE